MPLAFDSVNRGRIAFGFFNIDTDMLLLNNCFMFADAFCDLIRDLARCEAARDYEARFEAYVIDRGEDVGDLTGAIHGVRYQGFIGEVYRRFPFPKTHEEFKQKADGSQNREIVEAMIQSYAVRKELFFLYTRTGSHVTIGDYRFTRESFLDLVKYVWKGGMPGWKDGLRPAYVNAMTDEVIRSKNPILKELALSERP